MSRSSLRPAFVPCTLLLVLVSVAAFADAPGPEERLREAIRYLAGLNSVSANADLFVHVNMMGRDQKLASNIDARIERPNKWAIVADGEPIGMSIVSDGKQVFQYFKMLNRYTVTDATASSDQPLLSMGFDLAEAIKSFDPEQAYESIKEQITSSSFVGKEKVGDVECDHFRFDTKDTSVEVWIEVGERPLVWKVVPDLSKALSAGAEQQPALKDMKVEYSLTFSAWNVDPKFTVADFEFTPPAGAEKVESLFESFARRATPDVHAVLGQPAPPVELANLAGDTVSLADHVGKDVIVLDFWATWCGPCVAALPIISEVTGSFADRGVVFYAVDVGEDKQTVADFLAERKLKLNVLLDEKNEVASAYGVSGIPQTVIIGKDGRVQVVHVGFSPAMKPQLQDELERLLKGEDLAGPAVEAAAAARKEREEKLAAATKSPELKPAWSFAGKLSGLAVDAKSNLAYASSPSGGITLLDHQGKQVANHESVDAGPTIRLADLDGKESPEILGFRAWSSDLIAASNDGKQLWTYPQGDGIDDVWAANLDDDPREEIIVGFNGSTGLHVLDADGKLRWKNEELGNVWHVCAGDVNGDGKPEVVTTSAQGAVHVFDAADGTKIEDITVPLYANMIRTARAGEADQPDVILVAGSADDGEALVAVDLAGKVLWQTPLPDAGTPHVDSLQVAASQPWAAVAMPDGLIYVVDVNAGKIIAHADEQGQRPEVTWLQGAEGRPLLLVATGSAVNAFEVVPE